MLESNIFLHVIFYLQHFIYFFHTDFFFLITHANHSASLKAYFDINACATCAFIFLICILHMALSQSIVEIEKKITFILLKLNLLSVV